MYIPNSLWTWAFLVTTFVQAAIVLAIEVFIFAKFGFSLAPDIEDRPSSAETKTIPTYLTLFIFGFIYQLVLVYDTLRLKNTIQVIGLCLYNAGMLIYASIQFDQIKNAIQQLLLMRPPPLKPDTNLWPDIKPYLIAAPCVIAFFTVVLTGIAWKLYDEFAWTIYKHISADLRMKRRFLTFQIYIALLKFDFFFFLGFTVQFLVVVTSQLKAEKSLTAAAIPITVLILAMAAFWVRRENKIGMLVVMALYICGLAYFIFKLARMYQPSHMAPYLPVRKTLTGFAVITIFLIVLTIINATACMLNFDKGLKKHILKRKIGDAEPEKLDHMTELPELKPGQVPASSRMTID